MGVALTEVVVDGLETAIKIDVRILCKASHADGPETIHHQNCLLKVLAGGF